MLKLKSQVLVIKVPSPSDSHIPNDAEFIPPFDQNPGNHWVIKPPPAPLPIPHPQLQHQIMIAKLRGNWYHF